MMMDVDNSRENKNKKLVEMFSLTGKIVLGQSLVLVIETVLPPGSNYGASHGGTNF